MDNPTLKSKNDSLHDSLLIQVLSSSAYATAIYTSEKLHIGFVNDGMLRIWGKDRGVMGKTFEEAIPEMEGQPFTDLLKQVWHTGVTYTAENTPADLVVDGELQTFYFDFEYRPIKSDTGDVYSILHTAVDVTEEIRQGKVIVEKENHEQELFEELAASNEELTAINEEYLATNEELSATNEELTATIEELAQSQMELRYSKSKVEQILNSLAAPVVVLQGHDFIIRSVNQAILDFWNKTVDQVLGKPMLEVFPEVGEQIFPTIWKHVLDTGETVVKEEVAVYYKNDDGTERRFLADFHYQPLRDLDGKVNRVLATVIDNTERILARKTIEKAEEQLRLAIESSKLGTWHIDAKTYEFLPSIRMKSFFGYNEEDYMSYNDALALISDDCRDRVKNAMRNAMTKGIHFDEEFSLRTRESQQLRWFRATGKLYEDKDDGNKYFSGTLLDVTEAKEDDIRKNDFIGMVSHELKTPLTSLNAYLQMLTAKAHKAEDVFTAQALGKAGTQVKKMTSLINGFLNVSRLESGKIYLEKQEFDLEQLVDEVEDEMKLIHTSHPIIFNRCKPVIVDADRDKIGQVINNYLSNAIKYSPKGSPIVVECSETDGRVRVTVKDGGIGIQDQDKHKLFDRYYRVSNNQTQTVSGFGIGLYLCAEIIRRHEGEIGVDSEPGKGSAFYFELPAINNS
ncbi:PAS domain-containing protein [Mucilaginibacter sp. JRF]|uniref:PAS domain-containing sensor histidine kinase n=1 Tax=Mucilaginibacter sp. JRF TaxID=2780088 RepID=UPI001882C385|nr:PAS domain-containing sensor histidine kinase [Mucilaginibacter sp. JRF]MBE9583694.1 PAS domain-containing protein [Mucilaginibacter sp. JRF]